LSNCLNSKGITNDIPFTVNSARVGVNFECIIKTVDITVKAWTIIAEGPINRPHYRYLIK
jgi:hypothetical protein